MTNMEAIFIVVFITNIFVKVSNLEALILDNFSLPFKCMPWIHYLVQFKKDKIKVQAFLDSYNEVNIMTLAYTAKLCFKIQSTNVKTQKIDGFTFKTFEIILASF